MTARVQDHYGSADIVSRILAAIPWSDQDGTALSPAQLFPYDQLHGGGLMATRGHASRLNPSRGDHVLDIGSGIGGPARYMVATFGCRVTGLDLTPQFVAAAADLTRLCGLADRASFVAGDAAAMPFASDSFDGACCFYVGMNLPGKAAVLSEAARVLKPGARAVWTEVTLLNGDPHYPLPWSKSPDTSHLLSREALLECVSGAGFEVLAVEDESDEHLELARSMQGQTSAPAPAQHEANQVVLGEGFAERRKNYLRNLSEGRIASTMILARKKLI